MRSVKLTFVIALTLCTVICNSQDSLKVRELPICTIQNNDFKAILDSFMVNETKCFYFNDKLTISISFYRNLGKHGNILDIEAVPDSNIALGLPYGGFCYYKNHLVLFFADTCSRIYTIGESKKKFKYLESNKPVPNDGPETRWQYYYDIQKNSFKLSGRQNCDNDWIKTTK